MISALVSAAMMLSALAMERGAELDPNIHMLLQIPLLAAAGYVVGRKLTVARYWHAALLVCAISFILMWMLPKVVDEAVTTTTGRLLKYTTLPLLVGVPLGLSWPHTAPLLRGFLRAQAISMIAFTGFLYATSPVRLCNAYLAEDQIRTGIWMVVLSALIGLYWSLGLFLSPAADQIREPSRTQVR